MIDLQLAKMDDAHRQSQPSHISFILNTNADKKILQKVKEISGVKDVDSLTPLNVQYKLHRTSGVAERHPDYPS